jgi:preprotein translocase subunit SecA
MIFRRGLAKRGRAVHSAWFFPVATPGRAMINSFLSLFTGRHYKKFVRKCLPVVARINEIETGYQGLSDDGLRAKTVEFRERHQKGETLEHLLPEAFAAVKNAARRLCGREIIVSGHPLRWEMLHYDVQLIGGMALHERKIAEMATGEGKTLVATLPLYLNAITARNCHCVTVNDYLALRDSEWMGSVYKFLGLTVGCIQQQQPPDLRRAAYACDITYGTASEFGFDYLRDNGMSTRREEQVQREHYYCIVDEVDSILVDEARTPLIISGPTTEESDAPYMALRPGVERLYGLQLRLCNRLAQEAKEELEKPEGDYQGAVRKLLQVRIGMPKHRQLLKLMENGAYRKMLEKFDLEMSGDFMRGERHKMKEELYFSVDERSHQADLCEPGRKTLRPDNPDAFVMPDLPAFITEVDRRTELTPEQKIKMKQDEEARFSAVSEEIHCLSQLLKAYTLYERDKEYVVLEGKVHIVDENTGRLMPGRRWSEGLHQAVEAKEGVVVEKETKTYATITIQNYFRLYEKLAGMTGTAETEAAEFNDIYRLTVMQIPTHRTCIRQDLNDVVFKTRREKFNAVVADIQQAHARGQPVLVGTTSVEASEILSKMLKRLNIVHSVLNAKYHQQEAEIVARAGQRGSVTIATNMAGRGTDIKLGEGVPDLGGLYVLGTERHESRRIDRQLRGRCARQGDPGLSKFYVSLEDDLMRLFANAGPISRLLEKTMIENEPLEHPLLNRSIESAQKKVEASNYTARKRLLQYDDVLNRQREVIYGLRNEAIRGEHPREEIFELVEEELRDRTAALAAPGRAPDADALAGFLHWVNTHFPVALKPEDAAGRTIEELALLVLERLKTAYEQRCALETPEAMRALERYVIIRSIDRNWQDHLTEIDDLRKSVGLRSYGQRDPLNEYKSEAYTFFEQMMGRVRQDVCAGLFTSATNLQSFQSLLALMQRARQSGPDGTTTAIGHLAGGKGSTTTGTGTLPPLPRPATPAPSAGAAAPEAKLPKVAPRPVEVAPKFGRNDIVTVRRGVETQQVKYKKAELMMKEGWVLVPEKK